MSVSPCDPFDSEGSVQRALERLAAIKSLRVRVASRRRVAERARGRAAAAAVYAERAVSFLVGDRPPRASGVRTDDIQTDRTRTGRTRIGPARERAHRAGSGSDAREASDALDVRPRRRIGADRGHGRHLRAVEDHHD